MNLSPKYPTTSKSASRSGTGFTSLLLAIRRTDSAVLRNMIVVSALLIVTALVIFGHSTRSETGMPANIPAGNHSALQTAPHNASLHLDPGALRNTIFNASPGSTNGVSHASALPAYLTGSEVFTTRNGYVDFTGDMIGCLGVFAGDSRRLGGSVNLRTGTFEFHLYLKTLSTGIPDRDSGLQTALNLEKHPFAEFTGTFYPAFDLYSTSEQHVTAAGAFNLNGVTHQLEIPATLQAGQNGIILRAEWILDISDFGIQPPAFLSVTVSSEQEIRLEATLEPQLFASPQASHNTVSNKDT